MAYSINDIRDLYFNCDLSYLSNLANKICEKNYGNKIFLRGLLEFSNECKMNCLYCGIRNDNKKLKRYKIGNEEIISIIDKNYRKGFKTFVLQCGEFLTIKLKEICDLVYKIKNRYNDIAITLSCGYFSKKELKLLKNSGVDRYLLRFEIADEKIYSYLKNGLKLKDRIEMLYNLKELEFETGSGFMVGLPGETDEILLKNLELCYNLNLDMIGIGPFIPNPDTPLGHLKPKPFETTIKLTALLRIILPYSNIPATTASGTIIPDGREQLLKSGANVLMPNITPEKYKANYLLYPNKICLTDTIDDCLKCLNLRLNQIGKTISFDIGTSLNYKKEKYICH